MHIIVILSITHLVQNIRKAENTPTFLCLIVFTNDYFFDIILPESGFMYQLVFSNLFCAHFENSGYAVTILTPSLGYLNSGILMPHV